MKANLTLDTKPSLGLRRRKNIMSKPKQSLKTVKATHNDLEFELSPQNEDNHLHIKKGNEEITLSEEQTQKLFKFMNASDQMNNPYYD